MMKPLQRLGGSVTFSPLSYSPCLAANAATAIPVRLVKHIFLRVRVSFPALRFQKMRRGFARPVSVLHLITPHVLYALWAFVLSSIGGSVASAAPSNRPTRVAVFAVVSVTSRAMSNPRLGSSYPIFAWSHDLQVIRVYTSAISTKMVVVHPRRTLVAFEVSKDDAVVAVPLVSLSGPLPTTSYGVNRPRRVSGEAFGVEVFESTRARTMARLAAARLEVDSAISTVESVRWLSIHTRRLPEGRRPVNCQECFAPQIAPSWADDEPEPEKQ